MDMSTPEGEKGAGCVHEMAVSVDLGLELQPLVQARQLESAGQVEDGNQNQRFLYIYIEQAMENIYEDL